MRFTNRSSNHLSLHPFANLRAQKKDCCRYSGRRARSASQTRPAYSEELVPVFTASQDVRETVSARRKDSSAFTCQFNRNIRRRPHFERLKQAEEEDEEEIIVAMPTTGCPEKHEKRTIKERELHILETKRLAHEAASLREEIRRIYQHEINSNNLCNFK
ncbi:unnamed protein product [Rodentolepis nana]|uniref:TPX2 domain-containing protein n=1 Tax=Rodentolepis nana TaxID=102285 RepID=A0A0R3T3S0_RODNA|nr:unnamed protein product [Rodentolepis nana]